MRLFVFSKEKQSYLEISLGKLILINGGLKEIIIIYGNT